MFGLIPNSTAIYEFGCSWYSWVQPSTSNVFCLCFLGGWWRSCLNPSGCLWCSEHEYNWSADPRVTYRDTTNWGAPSDFQTYGCRFCIFLCYQNSTNQFSQDQTHSIVHYVGQLNLVLVIRHLCTCSSSCWTATHLIYFATSKQELFSISYFPPSLCFKLIGHHCIPQMS